MAQSVVAALCMVAVVAAAASAPSARASDEATAMHLLPVGVAEALTHGRAGGVPLQTELTGGVQRKLLEESWWAGSVDEGRSGVAGIQGERQLTATDDAVPVDTDKLLPMGAAETLTKGRAGGVAIQTDLTGIDVPVDAPAL